MAGMVSWRVDVFIRAEQLHYEAVENQVSRRPVQREVNSKPDSKSSEVYPALRYRRCIGKVAAKNQPPSSYPAAPNSAGSRRLGLIQSPVRLTP